MKKKVITACICLAAAVVLTGLLAINVIGGGKIAQGKYKVDNLEDYPDACIEVKGNTVQFYSIDLNALYREGLLKIYTHMVELTPDLAIPEEELTIVSDLNDHFVYHPYEITYYEDDKRGTFEYLYFCPVQNSVFVLFLKYDSFHKTITVSSLKEGNIYSPQIIFRK